MTDGTVCIEKMKINNQHWIYPLIEVNATVTGPGLTVEFISSNITNCKYDDITPPYKSAIIFFTNNSIQKLNMTISFSLFENNNIDLTSSGYGGLSYFYSRSLESCFFFLFLFFFNIFSYLCYQLPIH
jgi:hypothetical protein